VHPVPLGFGRVYVHTGDEFSYESWMAGLNAGRSFVTTGPLLDVRVNERLPGEIFKQERVTQTYRFTGVAYSERPLSKIEIVSQGRVVRTLEPKNTELPLGGFESRIDETIDVNSSTWFCIRCWQPTEDGRLRFAHSAPWHIELAEPLRPRPEEILYLIARVEEELERHKGVLPEAALAEYREALRIYREIERRAR
jgi:hypothetical protein